MLGLCIIKIFCCFNTHTHTQQKAGNELSRKTGQPKDSAAPSRSHHKIKEMPLSVFSYNLGQLHKLVRRFGTWLESRCPEQDLKHAGRKCKGLLRRPEQRAQGHRGTSLGKQPNCWVVMPSSAGPALCSLGSTLETGPKPLCSQVESHGVCAGWGQGERFGLWLPGGSHPWALFSNISQLPGSLNPQL